MLSLSHCACVPVLSREEGKVEEKRVKEKARMPLFMSDDEFSRYANDEAAAVLAEKADDHIKNLMAEVETVKALLDASSITAEQTCSILEHKHLSLSSDFSDLQAQFAQLRSSLTEVEGREHRLLIQCSHKDGEVERLTAEVSNLHQSKRQLMELVERKDLMLSENSASIKTYLDKIVRLFFCLSFCLVFPHSICDRFVGGEFSGFLDRNFFTEGGTHP